MIPPGSYFYVDEQPGAEPVACEIFEAAGTLWARFPRTAEDDGAELLVSDLPGRFLHELHLRSPAGDARPPLQSSGSRGQLLH